MGHGQNDQGSSKTTIRALIDAACVATDIAPALRTNQPLEVKANGHGNRQNVRMNKYGFPCSKPKQPFKDWQGIPSFIQ